MQKLFTPTDYDYMIGRAMREEYLNDEDLYVDMSLEDLQQMREQIITQINNNLTWYYLTCDAIRIKEKQEWLNESSKSESKRRK